MLTIIRANFALWLFRSAVHFNRKEAPHGFCVSERISIRHGLILFMNHSHAIKNVQKEKNAAGSSNGF